MTCSTRGGSFFAGCKRKGGVGPADDDDSPAPAPSALDDVDFAAIADDVLGMMDGDDVNGMIDTYETVGER